MKASALVRSPLKTSGRSPIGLASWARGTGRRLGGRLGPAGIGAPPPGGSPGSGGAPPPPPPPGGFSPPLYGLHSGGWVGPASSVRLKSLSKALDRFFSVFVVLWVTI